MSRKIYNVTKPGFMGKYYKAGERIVTDENLPRASWYEPEGGWPEEKSEEPKTESNPVETKAAPKKKTKAKKAAK